ncbi:MAG: GYD domain-containing protein [Chloroflexota bacterium]|nr:GYD domain-containing protein [Chloroflexota bacterium]
MALYMYKVAYSAEAWAAMVKNPQNRIEAVTPAIERAGGKIIGAWMAFGEYDLYAVAEMPGNIEASALAVAFTAGGALRSLETVPLLSVEDGVEVMRQAGGSTYKPPA